MTLPEQPPTFRTSTSEEQPWWWRLQNTAGDEVTVTGELADQRFPSQADAESWVGEYFGELADAGVDAVVLFEDDRQVYRSPMSLHA